MSLVNLPKTSTSPVIYQQTFKTLSDYFEKQNWKLIYTDGSKSNDHTTFAVVQQDGGLIKSGFIDNSCSNFTAEALGILMAVEFAAHNNSKYIICTDSLSSILAAKNTLHDSILINKIRNNINRNQNTIKIMWVPSHVGILGNEYADLAANQAKNRPLFKFSTCEQQDIINTINSKVQSSFNSKWASCTHSYKIVNPMGIKPLFPKWCSRNQTNTITRLRIGHCKFSHKHLLERDSPPQCTTCNTRLNVIHILDECSKYNSSRTNIFGSNPPSTLLKNTCDSNVKLIHKFLIENNLKNII